MKKNEELVAEIRRLKEVCRAYQVPKAIINNFDFQKCRYFGKDSRKTPRNWPCHICPREKECEEECNLRGVKWCNY